MPERSQKRIGCILLGLALLSFSSSVGAQTDALGPSPVVLLVYSPSADRQDVQALATAIRLQVGDALRLKVREASPPPAGGGRRAWGVALAEELSVDAVLWLEHEQGSEQATLWFLLGDSGSEVLEPFHVTEANDFDRLRSLAIGARSFLGELLDPPEDPQAQEPAPSPPSRAPEPVPPQPASPAVDAASSALALHGALGPTLRVGEDGVAVGVDARLGLRLGDHLSTLVSVGFTREERPLGAGSARDRVTLRSMLMATLPLGRGALSLGAGGALVISRLGQESGGRDAFAGTLALQVSGRVLVLDDLFLELPLIVDLRYAGQAMAGLSATPPVELSLGLMLGFGAP
jgi:hypothetical protein